MSPEKTKKMWAESGESRLRGRCEVCGFTPSFHYGEELRCPCCGNEPEEVRFSYGFVLLMPNLPEWSAWRR